MTFGHDPFIWTNPQVIKNAETASGTMVFKGMFDWVPGVGDDDEEDDNGGTGIDFIDDIVETVTEWTSKITETFKIGFDYAILRCAFWSKCPRGKRSIDNGCRWLCKCRK